jgi:hypothetical protein
MDAGAAARRRAHGRFVAVGNFQSEILLALKTGDFFGTETPMSAACPLGAQKSRVFPTLNGRVAHAAQTRDLFSGKAF